jgi:SAM-dependent methyltransferase
VGFDVSANAYDRYMGTYSGPLAPQFADLAGVAARPAAGLRALDVGCGPGALTAELVMRLGAEAVAAVDPQESFVNAARERNPGVDVRVGEAEDLPFADGGFDVALAQLVVHFMSDPVAGLREMARVSRSGGVVAACVWDHGGGQGPLSPYWEAARALDADVVGESHLAGSSEGQLSELFEAAGLSEVEETSLSVGVEHATFEKWWELFSLDVGPAGAHAARLDETARAQLRERARSLFPVEPFVLTARAWAARGLVR